MKSYRLLQLDGIEQNCAKWSESEAQRPDVPVLCRETISNGSTNFYYWDRQVDADSWLGEMKYKLADDED